MIISHKNTRQSGFSFFFYFYYRVVSLRWLVCKSCLSVVDFFLERGLKYCFSPGVIPDESKAMSLLAPANAVAGMMPGGGLLPTPNPLASMGGTPFGGLGAPNMEQMAAMGMPGPNMNPQVRILAIVSECLCNNDVYLSDDVLFLVSRPCLLNPLAAGLNLNPGLKTDASNKEIEEAMKRVREAQSLISAAIEPGNKKDDKRKHSRSRSRSRRRRSRSRSRHRRSKSRSRRRSHSRSRRRSKSPRRRRSHSRDRSRRSRSRSATDRTGGRKRSPRKGPRRPRKATADKEREKERDRDRREDRDRSRDERERSTSKKKKSKDKERDRDRKSDSEKGDVKVEQGYDSEKEKRRRMMRGREIERSEGHVPKKSKLNGDDHHQEDMEMSD
uniref:Serine and arginine rich splicing factor 11 n=1 Tax=Salarias fasciatus TaxID=181472 RepID=A0A672F653_SALFA